MNKIQSTYIFATHAKITILTNLAIIRILRLTEWVCTFILKTELETGNDSLCSSEMFKSIVGQIKVQSKAKAEFYASV